MVDAYGDDFLSARMTCSLEAAARAHATADVNLLMTSRTVRVTPLLHHILEANQNIRMLHLDAAQIFRNSPMTAWYEEKAWLKGNFPLLHYSDSVRSGYGSIHTSIAVGPLSCR